MEFSIALLTVILVLLVLLLANAIRIVPEFQRLVIFRLGRCIGQKGPGLVIIIPIIDRPVRVDLRELFLQIPHQTCITRDNAPISIDFLVYWKVVDPSLSVIKVQDFAGASQGIATTTLRAVVGDIPLDDVLAKRDQINEVLRTKLDEVTERWGVKVTTVEIREIVPPKEVQEAMNKQMAAERNRRAMVTEADGRREAAVKVAEGDKQAAILRAEGFALALHKVFEVASTVDAKTMGLQYLDALKALGASPATKIVFPLEFTSLLRPLFDQASSPGQAGGS
jgi:regulator of protease activity HflC (stomatin/prohibitin superfamily)